ncbi:MAG: LysM peptidoglycan-binding domain-containing protein [bacterium]|nr:LysM peptidoglycan-binding domain-containing protein [bacterium]
MNNYPITTKSGKINNVNMEKISKLKRNSKMLLKVVTYSLTATIVISGFGIFKGIKADEPVIPLKDQNVVMLEEVVDSGETIYDIASKYYKDDYKSSYGGVNDYAKRIMTENDLYASNIYPNEVLNVPVIVDNDNPIYTQMKEIENKIKELEENNYWVTYEVKAGDNISTLAWLSSGDLEDMKEASAEIRKKNNMGVKDFLQPNSSIYIVNPEIGNLKMELNNLKVELAESMSNNQIKK